MRESERARERERESEREGDERLSRQRKKKGGENSPFSSLLKKNSLYLFQTGRASQGGGQASWPQEEEGRRGRCACRRGGRGRGRRGAGEEGEGRRRRRRRRRGAGSEEGGFRSCSLFRWSPPPGDHGRCPGLRLHGAQAPPEAEEGEAVEGAVRRRREEGGGEDRRGRDEKAQQRRGNESCFFFGVSPFRFEAGEDSQARGRVRQGGRGGGEIERRRRRGRGFVVAVVKSHSWIISERKKTLLFSFRALLLRRAAPRACFSFQRIQRAGAAATFDDLRDSEEEEALSFFFSRSLLPCPSSLPFRALFSLSSQLSHSLPPLSPTIRRGPARGLERYKFAPQKALGVQDPLENRRGT